MKLLVSSSIFPNSMEPTKGIYIFYQTRAMASHVDVRVVAPVPYFPKWLPSQRYRVFSAIPRRENFRGLSVFHPQVLVTPKVGRFLYGYCYAASLYLPLLRLFRSFRPQVVIGYWIYPDGFANVLLCKHFGIPVLLGARGCDVNDLDDQFGKRAMVTWALKSADGVMAVSNAMREKMIGLGVDHAKIRTISNGLDDRFFAEELSRHPQINPKTILYCGRLSQEKGVDDLIRAAALLRDHGMDFRLVLVGDGPERESIKALAETFNLTDRMQLVGEVEHDRVIDYMKAASVLCLPSIREGWPNVVMEALACGIPVVASEVGGVPEILTSDSMGYMVPSRSPEKLYFALQQALIKNWDRTALRDAVRGKTWDNVGVEVLRFAREIMR